jgi:hypothetical protein
MPLAQEVTDRILSAAFPQPVEDEDVQRERRMVAGMIAMALETEPQDAAVSGASLNSLHLAFGQYLQCMRQPEEEGARERVRKCMEAVTQMQ